MMDVIIGIGNKDGGDDAVGPYIIDLIVKEKHDVSFEFNALDVGVVPENYTGVIKEMKPDRLIIIDAVDMSLNPGEFRIIPPESIGVMHVSTHGIPLSVFIGYLHQFITSIILIGVQPLSLNGEISDGVKQAARKIIDIIKDNQLSEIPLLEHTS